MTKNDRMVDLLTEKLTAVQAHQQKLHDELEESERRRKDLETAERHRRHSRVQLERQLCDAQKLAQEAIEGRERELAEEEQRRRSDRDWADRAQRDALQCLRREAEQREAEVSALQDECREYAKRLDELYQERIKYQTEAVASVDRENALVKELNHVRQLLDSSEIERQHLIDRHMHVNQQLEQLAFLDANKENRKSEVQGHCDVLPNVQKLQHKVQKFQDRAEKYKKKLSKVEAEVQAARNEVAGIRACADEHRNEAARLHQLLDEERQRSLDREAEFLQEQRAVLRGQACGMPNAVPIETHTQRIEEVQSQYEKRLKDLEHDLRDRIQSQERVAEERAQDHAQSEKQLQNEIKSVERSRSEALEQIRELQDKAGREHSGRLQAEAKLLELEAHQHHLQAALDEEKRLRMQESQDEMLQVQAPVQPQTPQIGLQRYVVELAKQMVAQNSTSKSQTGHQDPRALAEVAPKSNPIEEHKACLADEQLERLTTLEANSRHSAVRQQELEAKNVQLQTECDAAHRSLQEARTRVEHLEVQHNRETEANRRLRLALMKVQGIASHRTRSLCWQLRQMKASVTEDLVRLQEEMVRRPLQELSLKLCAQSNQQQAEASHADRVAEDLSKHCHQLGNRLAASEAEVDTLRAKCEVAQARVVHLNSNSASSAIGSNAGTHQVPQVLERLLFCLGEELALPIKDSTRQSLLSAATIGTTIDGASASLNCIRCELQKGLQQIRGAAVSSASIDFDRRLALHEQESDAKLNLTKRELTSEVLSAETEAGSLRTELSAAHTKAMETSTELNLLRTAAEKAERRQTETTEELEIAKQGAAKAFRELKDLQGSSSALVEASTIEAQRPLRRRFTEVLDEVEGLQRKFTLELRRRDKEWSDLLQQKSIESSAEADRLTTKLQEAEQALKKVDMDRQKLAKSLDSAESQRNAALAEAERLQQLHACNDLTKEVRARLGCALGARPTVLVSDDASTEASITTPRNLLA
eukprot:gnl/MRDRNA2_/MRDRNA2_103465_c0_seq1.p1 gnl/MRDRNA2_/MRDRNA2_103465_c0~~gnl/MRDRNA2_/MRDRNA2_103465_c0_seq1.p1  ORF type:complete len:991 (-),score=281.28 gnl/MRDRNA2_/MRDRNA2_103465_c0_seq1:32-3004(-)